MQIKFYEKVVACKVPRIFLSIVLMFALLISILPASTASAKTNSNADKNKAIYVALGDSVPAGYGLTNAKDCYVNLFSNGMADNGYTNTMYNYAVSGTTTEGLLSSLKKMQSDNGEALKTLKNANVITINIGGNNVLGPLVKAVNDQMEQQFKDLGIKDIASATDFQLMTIGLALYSMKLEPAQLSKIEQGIQSFSKDFPEIIQWVKTNAPSANIIVSTVYNPIPDFLSFYKDSETMLNQMNTLIKDGSKQNAYYVADVNSAFMNVKDTQILNLNIGQFKDVPYSVDIHPNTEGHKLIAKLHNDIFKTMPNIIITTSKSPITAMITQSGFVNSHGTLKANITKNILSSAIDKAQKESKRLGRENDGIAVIFNYADTKTKSINVTFEDDAIDLLKSKGVKEIAINTGALHLSFDKESIKKLQLKANKNVTVYATPISKLSKASKKLIGSRPVYSIVIKDSKGKNLSDLGKGKMLLSVRYLAKENENTKKLRVVSINSKGQPKLLSASYADGWVNFTANTAAAFGIGYNK